MRYGRLPPITLTSTDAGRLYRLVEAWTQRNSYAAKLLAAELDRASIVDAKAISPDVVTMHSRVVFRLNAEHDIEAALVYPGEEDIFQRKISVVTPVGAALLGLAAGLSLDLVGPRGRALSVAVSRIVYQPESATGDNPSAG